VLIGFFGSALQFSVDKYEPDRALPLMFNFLVVVWSAAVVLHNAGLSGYQFF
jgi:hypothetical protein